MSARRRSLPGTHSVHFGSSPLLAAKMPLGRSRFVVAALALGLAALVARALWVQVIHADFYRAHGDRLLTRSEEVPATRGRIVDRNGLLLAATVPTIDVGVTPAKYVATPAQQRALARALGLSDGEIARRLRTSAPFTYLQRGVDADRRDTLKGLEAAGVQGLRLEATWRRSYPEGEAAAPVVGFTDLEQKGLEGVERSMQAHLQGVAGQRNVLRAMNGVVQNLEEPVAPQHGADVQLSIDLKLQFVAYQQLRNAVREHNARSASAIVLDVRTGEILALANYPSYDPENRRSIDPMRLRNRALTDIFEPGSTMKAFTVALALDRGLVQPSTVVDTAPGSIVVTGSVLRDHHPLGALTVAEVLQKSSNVGTVKLAQRMTPRQMHDLFAQVGLGSKPEIEFPGLATGKLRPYATWKPVEQATMSYGYGLSTSLLQLARAYTVFARDGELLPVTLLRRDPAAGPVAGEPVLKPQTARAVREMLRMAAGPGGTAPKAQALGYSVGGKTGTARKQEGKTYSTDKYRAWFVGLAPVSNPRLVVAVLVDEPRKGVYYGGEVAAPVFRQIVQDSLRQLGTPPDIEFRPEIIARPGAAETESF